MTSQLAPLPNYSRCRYRSSSGRRCRSAIHSELNPDSDDAPVNIDIEFRNFPRPNREPTAAAAEPPRESVGANDAAIGPGYILKGGRESGSWGRSPFLCEVSEKSEWTRCE